MSSTQLYILAFAMQLCGVASRRTNAQQKLAIKHVSKTWPWPWETKPTPATEAFRCGPLIKMKAKRNACYAAPEEWSGKAACGGKCIYVGGGSLDDPCECSSDKKQICRDVWSHNPGLRLVHIPGDYSHVWAVKVDIAKKTWSYLHDESGVAVWKFMGEGSSLDPSLVSQPSGIAAVANRTRYMLEDGNNLDPAYTDDHGELDICNPIVMHDYYVAYVAKVGGRFLNNP